MSPDEVPDDERSLSQTNAMTSPTSAAGGAESVTGIGLLRIDHVGVAVSDLDEAIAFYERVFGMTCVHTEVNEEQGVREAMLAVGPTGNSADSGEKSPSSVP